MAGRRICAGYYRRYDRKVVYVVSLAIDADTGEETAVWTAEAHQLNRDSVDHLQKKFFSALACLLKERDEAEELCQLRKPVQK